VAGGCRKLHDELHNTKYYEDDQIKKDEMGTACSRLEEMGNAHKILAKYLWRRNYLKNLGTDGGIILKWIINMVRRCGMDSSG
jgi:hypothetical protein